MEVLNENQDFNLSEKIIELEKDSPFNTFINTLEVKNDVKEFIRRLKDLILPNETKDPYILYSDVINKINRLAGEDLSK